jgi:UDP-N-acetylmuramate--alanine ligase
MSSKEVKLDKTAPIHFIGIGGAGMSGIAKVLLERGFQISGSDIKESRNTNQLRQLNADIYIGHNQNNLGKAKLVVISSAIRKDNVEWQAAISKSIPVVSRAEMLALICQQKVSIAVAGSHGKTTTTSMIAWILRKAGLDPSFLIGGELNDIGSNGKSGKGKFCVVEADESDGSLIHLRTKYQVITNIEADHLDYYRGLKDLEDLFRRWLSEQPESLAIVLGDESNVSKLVKELGKNHLTFGLSKENDLYAGDVKLAESGSTFNVYSSKSGNLGKIRLKVLGLHNIFNALAAISLSLSVGVKFKDIAPALADFGGVRRRFQVIGYKDKICVVDDYAHHPTEVKATLQTAKLGKWNRVICVFQPHRYSRTKCLSSEFGKAFTNADLTIMTEVYPAGEGPIPGVSGKLLVDKILQNKPRQEVVYLPRKWQISEYLSDTVQQGDLVLTMGAGDIWTVGDQLLERLD